MKKSIIEAFLDLLYRTLRQLGALALALSLIACEGGGGSAAEGSPSPSPSPDGPTPQAKSVTLKSGSNFSCFIYNGASGQVWCENEVPVGVPEPVNFGPGGSGCSGNGGSCRGTDGAFILAIESSSPITELEVRDDTICWTTVVSQRPVSRDAGLATYCVGEASLNGASLGGRTYVYGASYTDAANGATSQTYALLPFLGVEGASASELEGWGIFTDAEASVAVETLSCSLLGVTLTCPDFTVEVQ